MTTPERLRGIPQGMLCRCRDAIKELGISHHSWKRWVDAGLPVSQPGTECAMVFSDDLIEWLRENPTLPPVK